MALTRDRPLRFAASVAALVLFAAPLFAESFLPQYRSGLKALESEEWEAAADFFRQAISVRSEAKNRLARLRYMQPYLPHFYLGQALRAVEDCEAALQAWRVSAEQGVVRRRERLLARMRDGIRQCEEHVAMIAALLVESDAAIDRATRAESSVEVLQADPVMRAAWRAGDPSLAARQAAAAELLRRARHLHGDRTPLRRSERLDEARRLALESLDSFDLLRGEALPLQQQLLEAGGALGSELETLEEMKRRGFELLRQISDLKPYPPLVQRRRDQLQSALAASSRIDDDVGSQYLDALADRLSTALRQFQAATARPSFRLRSAASAFVDAANEEVVELLGEYKPRGSRERFHTHLLLAAAHFNLYLIDSSRAGELRAATADVLAAREADDSTVPSPRVFSPRFVRFFDRISLASAPAGG